MQFLPEEQQDKLRDILVLHLPAFGCKCSQVRMSRLTPIDVELKDNATGHLTAAGRCLTYRCWDYDKRTNTKCSTLKDRTDPDIFVH